MPRFFCHLPYFFVQNEPRLTVTWYSSRLGSSCLYSFSAICQVDDKVCHQLEAVKKLKVSFFTALCFLSGILTVKKARKRGKKKLKR